MKYSVILVLCCIAAGISAKSTRIINGVRATEGEFPYQVSIQVDGQHICGGSLIGKKHVLTAAHCTNDFILAKFDKKRIKVVVGSTNVNGGTKMDIDRVSRHGSYVHNPSLISLIADVSVIRLKKEITESAKVKPISLPRPNQEYPEGTPLIISGFGSSRTGGPTSQHLEKISLRTVSQYTCQAYWPQMLIDSGRVCATLAPGYGTCSGDSGGPLAYNKQVLVGIVSAGSAAGCATGIPDIFTKVSYYMDYIQSELAMTS